jgi:hypothetical protein
MELLEGLTYGRNSVTGNAARYSSNCTGFSKIFLTS